MPKYAKTDKKTEKTLEDVTTLKRQQELKDIRAVLSTEEGRRFFWKLLEDGGVFQASFTKDSRTFYNLGRREFVLKYFNDLMEIGIDVFAKMQAEHKKDLEVWEELENA